MDFFTIKEAAEKMKISRFTVTRLLKSGELKYCKVGHQIRITSKHLYDYAHGTRATDTATDTEGAPKC